MDQIYALIKKMTLAQKIGQLTQYDAAVLTDSDAAITGPKSAPELTNENLSMVGSILNFKDADEMKRIQDVHLKQDPNQIPLVFMMDVIHGYRTIYPIPLALAGSFDPALAKACAAMAAKEASLSGVQVTFAPMVDYVRDARWGRVMESGGEEPLLTGAIAAAQIEGFEGENVANREHIASCVKHFAGYGGAEAGRDYNLAELSMRELYTYYLPAYKACIDAGVKLLMPSFNSLNGVPSVANHTLMKRILKDEWQYDGVVISDYNAIGELIVHGVAEDQREAARMAFENGCDIEMCSSTYFHSLEALVRDGVFSEQQIDEAVYRVLALKNRLGLFDDPYHGANQEQADTFCLSGENRLLAKKAAEESAVLLKNNGLLPLDRRLKRLALIGPFADNHAINGFWSCMGRDEDCVTVAEGIRTLLPNADIVIEMGCSCAWDNLDGSKIPHAVEAARHAQAVVLCLGEAQSYSGEGNCRTELGLPGMQLELAKRVIEANPNTAVVLFNGRPLVLTELEKLAPAILDMFFPGSEGGSAAAALLFGDANPCGKLTMSFPRAVGQCPIYYNHPNTGRPSWSTQNTYHAYQSNYIDCATLPLYSFGYGLSYSRFVYESMHLSAKQLSEGSSLLLTVKLRNAGNTAGKETVQVYMRDLCASVIRPVQQLIAFKKVSLSAGEEQDIVFSLTDDMFRFYNMEGRLIWELGKTRIMVGCADHFVLTDEIEII